MLRKNPIQRNEAFECENCEKHNPKAKQTCRNHCRFCFYSKHVDEKTPGDRLSTCHGLMKPLAIEFKSKKGYQILHECLRCGKKMLNKLAEDDDQNTMTKIILEQNHKLL